MFLGSSALLDERAKATRFFLINTFYKDFIRMKFFKTGTSHSEKI